MNSVEAIPAAHNLATTCPVRGTSSFVDLEAEAAGLQAWLESVATPMVPGSAPDVPVGGLDDRTLSWEDFPPSGLVLDALAALDLSALDDDELLSAAAALEKSGSSLHALQARVLAKFASRRPGYLGKKPASLFDESAGDEVAAVLHVAPRTGAGRLDWAIELTTRLPKTLAAMVRGDVSYTKALIMAEETLNLRPEALAAAEEQVLDGVGELTPGQLRRRVKRAVLTIDADAAARRAAEARKERKVAVSPQPDGMAEFWALLPAQDATALYTRLTDLARRAIGGETRSMDQRRADALSEVIYGHAGATDRALVQLIMTDATLAGHDDEPAELVGYGPITAATARNIAADGIWQALHTDDTGVVTGVGRNRYRPSAALADLIRARDVTCRFPGCAQPAARTDIDHTIRFPYGKTEEGNRGCLCRRHHRAKTVGETADTGWKVTRRDSGAMEWSSPTGRTYTTHPRCYTNRIAR